MYQGDAEVATDNTLVGTFTFAGLDTRQAATEAGLVITYALDHDGVLDVEALERATGRRLKARIDNVLGRKDADQMRQARAELDAALGRTAPEVVSTELTEHEPRAGDALEAGLPAAVRDVLRRAAAAMAHATAQDGDEMRAISEKIRAVAGSERRRGRAPGGGSRRYSLLRRGP